MIFSGGRGSKSIIKSLNYLNFSLKISLLINLYDDGKSSGVIRDLFNMPGPSDSRKLQQLFIEDDNSIPLYKKKIFKLRISLSPDEFKHKLSKFINDKNSSLFDIKINDSKFRSKLKKYLKEFTNQIEPYNINCNDLSLMNLIYAGVYISLKKDINRSIKTISKLFGITNNIYSCGLRNLYLCGINKKNKIYYTESQIVEQRSNENMKEIFLTKNKLDKSYFIGSSNNSQIKKIQQLSIRDKISDEAKILISKADIIIYSTGTPFSSLYPSYYVKGIGKHIAKNKKAKKVLITNIGADYETPDFNANDYINNTLKYLRYDYNIPIEQLISHCIVNKTTRNHHVSDYVEQKYLSSFNVIYDFFEKKNQNGIHDHIKLSKILMKII